MRRIRTLSPTCERLERAHLIKIFGKAGTHTFTTQAEAERYLILLPEGYNGRTRKLELGNWMVSYRLEAQS